MNDEPVPTSTNPPSKAQLPAFVEMLSVPQKNLIKGLWNVDDLSISDKIDSIDEISDKMPLEARREYRKWRFQMDRSRMPDFYDSQNKEIKTIIAGMFKESTGLEEFARIIMSIKPALNNPGAFDKWMNEEIEFKQLPPFVEMLNASQKNLIKNLWKADDLSISDRIDIIDSISKDMPKEARVEYRKWRFLMDRDRMPNFYYSQNEEIKTVISAVFEKHTDLEEFTRVINSFKSSLNNPKLFENWTKSEHIGDHSCVHNDTNKCYVKCKKDRTGSSKLDISSRRVEVDLICPQSMKGNFCLKNIREWYCADCRERLQYDFKRNFYCECGHASINTFLFHCYDPKHQVDFIGFDDNYISSLVSEIKPYRETNILILGEIGVGKSTWINAISNYLTYSTMEEAEHGKQIYLVPSQFTITDSNQTLKKITVGKSENETHEEGASSTQHPRSYVFNIGKKSIRLIDTPGIGDTRGADVDNKNLTEIFKFIAQFDEIHGICILLKPNNTRLNLMFRYCINELLTHLDVTAAANIAFCFTNTRGTFYRPGDTMPALNTYLDNLKSEKKVEIPTDEDRVYCMDNESFRFLCCLHEKEYFSDEEKKNFEQSWNISVKETNRLLDHFENHVQPHDVARIVSLNSARELILTLAKPLVDISQIIQDNITAMNEKVEEIQALNVTKDDLMKQLMIAQIGLEPKELGFPQTVCTGVNCIEIMTLPNNYTQAIYKTICHERCYELQDVVPETVPNRALQRCDAMDSKTLNCKNCQCPWSLHMHTTYTQEKIETLIEDSEIQKKLSSTNSYKEAREAIVKACKNRINIYKAEQSAIDEACAKFAAFLNEHAIIAYNDAVEEYLKFNIREAEQVAGNTGSKESSQKVERLQQQLRQYIEKKGILSSQLANGTAQLIGASDIQEIQKELEKLEMTGSNIKLLLEATMNGKEVNLVHQELYFNKASYQKRRRIRRPYLPPTGYDSSGNGNETDTERKNKDKEKPDFQKLVGWATGWLPQQH